MEKALPCPLPSSALGLLCQPGLGLAASAFICPIGLCQYLFRALGSLQGTPGTFSNYARGAPRSGGSTPGGVRGWESSFCVPWEVQQSPEFQQGKGPGAAGKAAVGTQGEGGRARNDPAAFPGTTRPSQELRSWHFPPSLDSKKTPRSSSYWKKKKKEYYILYKLTPYSINFILHSLDNSQSKWKIVLGNKRSTKSSRSHLKKKN